VVVFDFARTLHRDVELRGLAEDLLRVADLGVSRIEVTERRLRDRDPSDDLFQLDLPENPGPLAYTLRLVHDSDGLGEEYPLPFDAESAGTKSWLGLMVPALLAMGSGQTLLIDEVGASLHPVLTAELIRIFKDSEINRTGAQLIFTSRHRAARATAG
jgi:hypothetical protein